MADVLHTPIHFPTLVQKIIHETGGAPFNYLERLFLLTMASVPWSQYTVKGLTSLQVIA